MLHFNDPPEEFDPLTREDPSAFSPPPAFGPFRVLHQIGIGALGPVFRTYEPTRDRLVAVKVFRLDIVPEQAQALADALGRATQASLFHPSIVEPIAAGVEGTLAYRADEYVAAESLDVAMRHYAPATLEKALPFITQLAGAIDFARAAGVGHGALHPRDVFVTPDEARATGFGVVEALERVGIRAPVRRPYAAPERIDGAGWSTPADIFSLAAITFELLTGRRPSGTGSEIGALPDGLTSAALHAVLARAMDDDPAKRFPTALAFVAALEASGHRGIEAPLAVTGLTAVTPVTGSSGSPGSPGSSGSGSSGSAGSTRSGSSGSGSSGSAGSGSSGSPAIEPLVLRPEPIEPIEPVEPEPVELVEPAEPVEPEPEEPGEPGEPEEPGPFGDRPLFDPDSSGGPERFADEFVEEQAAEAESRRPLEAVHETVPPAFASSPTMFGAAEPEPEIREYDDRSRLRMLPVALGFVLGLLIGFGIGHFMGRQSRDGDTTAATAAPPPNQPAATGAATPQQPGQYSEQKVTPPAAASTQPPPAPPPVPDETPATAARSGEPRRGSPATPAAPTRGRLVVTSTPNRAGVTLNGDWRGRTPLTLDSLPFGRYVIRVVLPGYDVSRHELTLSARESTQEVRARLDRAAPPARSTSTPPAAARTPTAKPAPSGGFTGSLYVDSRPRGATVFLDGKSVGQTPLSLPEVSIGAHVVRLELEGKRTWTASTRVVSGETARVTGSLEDRNQER